MATGTEPSAAARPALCLTVEIPHETLKILNNLLYESHPAQATGLSLRQKDTSLTTILSYLAIVSTHSVFHYRISLPRRNISPMLYYRRCASLNGGQPSRQLEHKGQPHAPPHPQQSGTHPHHSCGLRELQSHDVPSPPLPAPSHRPVSHSLVLSITPVPEKSGKDLGMPEVRHPA